MCIGMYAYGFQAILFTGKHLHFIISSIDPVHQLVWWIGVSARKPQERKIYMKYKVIYKEVLHHTFEVEANSREEAKKEFERLADAGEIDFSYGEVIDTETIIQPAETDE